MNANEVMLAVYANPDASYPDADPDTTLLLNLNAGYADTDTALCIRIMSLCFNRSKIPPILC